ncbi:carbohydrate-binding family 9-like protein [Runella sp.]|uniref:carbohydrate-binding family 9-like protein n=1 Tax=Runella sp. TaxID=1960881 RepID=UPI003D0E769A
MPFIYLILLLMHSGIPEINLTKGQWAVLSQTHFSYATDGQEAPQQTLVKLSFDDDHLYVDFECRQNPFWNENTYKKHNTEMWNQEVFELFIAEGEATPTQYLELEINPNNALFVGWIDNPTKEAPQKLTFVDYDKADIKHEVKTGGETWAGKMQIPRTLLGGKKATYRLNFYRIVSLQSHTDPNWKCSPADCAFTCWSASMSGATPRFHRPDAFGRLTLR